MDSLPAISRLIFSRWRHIHNNPIAKNANPTGTDIANPNTGIKQKTITAPNEEIPDVNATVNHSIPQTAKDKGLLHKNAAKDKGVWKPATLPPHRYGYTVPPGLLSPQGVLHHGRQPILHYERKRVLHSARRSGLHDE